MAKWVAFVHQFRPPGRKTELWAVHTQNGGERLGSVRWYSQWRRYAFFPDPATLYEQDCLRDIADFCETQTEERRRARALALSRR